MNEPPAADPHLTEPRDDAGGAMVALATAPGGIQAHLLVSLLDSRGVESRVVGEHTSAFGPFGGSATVTIVVRREDYPRAIDELKAFLLDRESEGHEFVKHATKCPICGYDMGGLGVRTRCPECGIDQDALSRVKQWIQITPPPREPGVGGIEAAVETTGITLGAIIAIAGVIGVVVLVVLMMR